MRSMLASLAVVLIAAPVCVRAQEPSAEFPAARQQYMAGEARSAARTLLLASLYVRQQVGRSKDEVVGMGLLDAEGQLEKLAASLKAGGVAKVESLDRTLSSIDRLLARHHLQMASAVIAKPRADAVPMAARDLDRAAFHFERSITLNGGHVASEPAVVIADVRMLSKEMRDSNGVPKNAAAIVASLESFVVGSAVVTALR